MPSRPRGLPKRRKVSESDQSELWPNHFKPLPGELLSSWLVRLAHAHGYKSEQLCSMLLGRGKAMWNRDVDRSPSRELCFSLMRVAAVNKTQIHDATLTAYEGDISERVNPNGSSRWIVPLSIFHRKRRSPGLMYCPLCLARDGAPHYRKQWRLSFVTVCPEHQVELLDRCDACLSPIAPHRVDFGRDGYVPRKSLFVLCACCGRDLRKAVPQRAKPNLVAWTARLQHAAEAGFLSWGAHSCLHSILFFDGLRSVVAAILSRAVGTPGDFDRSALSVRRNAMTEMAIMLGSDEVMKAVAYARFHGMRFSDVAGTHVTRPFWLEATFESLKPAQQPYHSAQELKAMATELERRYGRVSAKLAQDVFGANCPHGQLPGYFHQQVSDSTYESLMVSLDHAIGAAFDERKRMALLQDKLSFAMMRVLGVSAADLARMQVAQARKLLPRPRRCRHPGFRPVPTSPEELRHHLWWHVEKVRPRIPGADLSPFLFLSSYTGTSIGDTGIGMRFQSAVRRAHLTSAISCMSAFRRVPVVSAA